MNNKLNKPTLKPKDKDELIQFIEYEIKEHGNKCNLNHIDTSLITEMSYLFSNDEFNGFGFQDFNGDISLWDTSNVQNMSYLFYKSKFNQNISLWNTSNVEDMFFMFVDSVFNQDISSWNTFSVTTMKNMFYNSQFNQDISLWNTSNVTDMSAMFQNSQFNQNISQWNTSNVTDMGAMFASSQFNQDISNWDTSNVRNIRSMFGKSQITKIPKWNYFKIDNIQNCFDDCLEIIESLPDWYQFNHIDNAQDRRKAYDDYLKSKKLNNSISHNLNIKYKKPINKI